MSVGMQVYNSSGNLLIDTSTYVGHFINSFTTTSPSGSITNPLLTQGTPFGFALSPPSGKTSTAPFLPSRSAPSYPVVTIVGDVLSWRWEEDPATIPPEGITIQYGVF